jgi:hypothetical protein
VLLSDQERTVDVFDAQSGNAILHEESKLQAGAMFTPDGKLVLVVDNEITLRNPVREKILEPLAGRILGNADGAAVLMDVGQHYAVVAPSRDVPELVALPLPDLANGQPVSLVPPAAGDKTVHPVGALVDDHAIYVFSSLVRRTPLASVKNAQTTYGLHVARFDLPTGKPGWNRLVVSDIRVHGRFAWPINAADHLLAGVIGANAQHPGAWFVLDKAGQSDPVELGLSGSNPRNQQANKRQREIGVAVVASDRVMVETGDGLVIYGGK